MMTNIWNSVKTLQNSGFQVVRKLFATWRSSRWYNYMGKNLNNSRQHYNLKVLIWNYRYTSKHIQKHQFNKDYHKKRRHVSLYVFWDDHWQIYIFNHIILIHKPVNVLILIFLFLFLTWYSTPIDINVDKRTL